MAKHEIVILGGGLGGLECGVILSKEGYDVCVVEKNPVIGGCLQTFRRRGLDLDTGIHYLGSLDDGQILNQYFRYFGVMDSLRLTRMDEKAFDSVMLGGREYGFGMGYDNFAANFKEHFPRQSGNIDRFCDMLKGIGRTMGVDILRRGMISQNTMQYIEQPAHDTIASIIDDPVLAAALAGTSPLYAGIRNKTSLYHYGMINHSFIESSYRFVGGSQQLADALADKIREHGGTVMTGAEVTKICVTGNRANGVELTTGEKIEADSVISSIHPAVTFDLLEKTPQVRKAYMTRLRSLENSYGIFSVYLVMKSGAMAYHNRNYYIYEGMNTWDTGYDMVRDVPRVVLLNMQANSEVQQNADLVSLLCPMEYAPFARWEGTKPEGRGEEYRALKERLAERIIDFAAQRFPAIRGNVEAVYTTSPLSYRDYTATPGGSAYGIIKDHRSPLTTLVSINTRLENMLLTGQNINAHGALGVTVTAALTCSKLLGVEYLAKKIGDA